MGTMRIAGGRVIDPANGIDAVRDLWIENGHIVAAPEDPAASSPDRTLDARGYVVMPGGVDVHCHIAGSKVNTARLMQPEDRTGSIPRRDRFRSGTTGSVPSSFATGYQYAGLGYTTAIDAAIAPLGARLAHAEFQDVPVLDKAFLILLGNNHLAMDLIRAKARPRLRDYVSWLLRATRAFGVKIVNPGGIETWKQGKGSVTTLDDEVPGFGVTPRSILVELAQTVESLALPHPVHVHGLNLGLPGNAATTLATMRALDGLRSHMAHIQFHSYGGEPGDLSRFDSGVAELAGYFNEHDNLSLDVGQVLFGTTTSMTADGAVGQYLHSVTGRKWYSHDIEQETGCGVVPITYLPTNVIHAWQWSIGLEWFLRVEDPWRIALSTDHPNGGSFLAYPEIIALLMSKNLRDEALSALPEAVRTRTPIRELSREYSLSEIAIVTRAAPARMLGLTRKGHLGIGADADVTIYAPDDDKRRMFALPRWVIKDGVVILDDGVLHEAPQGRTIHVAPEFNPEIETEIADHFERHASLRFRNFPIRDEELSQIIAWR